MGTGLEMSIKTGFMGAALGLMAACGSMNEGGIGKSFVQDRLAPLVGIDPPAPVRAPVVNLATAAPGEVLLVTILSRNAMAPLTKSAQSGNTTTWVSPGNVTITLENDIVIATRGLNEDLMGADIRGTRAALAAGGGSGTRTHSYLDSEDQIQLRRFTCVVVENGPEKVADTTGSRDAIKYTETCTTQGLVFNNQYWLTNRGGAMIQSRQAIAPISGFLQINPL